MTIERDSLWQRLKRPLLIVVGVATVLVLPTWLWFVRGRQLPLRVLVTADRYVARVGSTIHLTGELRPAQPNVTVSWHGPGLSSSALQTQWRLPSRPGIYVAKLDARRSGSVASDTISVEVIERALKQYPLQRPPQADRSSLKSTPLCKSSASSLAKPAVAITGRRCWGSNIVVKIEAHAEETMLWWSDKPEHIVAGPLANLRIWNKRDDRGHEHANQRTITISVTDHTHNCRVTTTHTVAIENCVGGPRAAGLFAEFTWRLIGPAVFRFTAKPPRDDHGSTSYVWTFGDGELARSDKPVIVHRFRDGKAQHVVTLETQRKSEIARAQRAVHDRWGSPALQSQESVDP